MIFSSKNASSLMVGVAAIFATAAPSVSAYPDVSVVNSTPHDVKGRVEYLSWLCTDDGYTATPELKWSNGRGACLITDVKATMHPDGGSPIGCAPYKSSGTSYSQFAVLYDASSNECQVTRIVN